MKKQRLAVRQPDFQHWIGCRGDLYRETNLSDRNPPAKLSKRESTTEYAKDRELFIKDAFGGADPTNRLPVRIITELAWHSPREMNAFLNHIPR